MVPQQIKVGETFGEGRYVSSNASYWAACHGHGGQPITSYLQLRKRNILDATWENLNLVL